MDEPETFNDLDTSTFLHQEKTLLLGEPAGNLQTGQLLDALCCVCTPCLLCLELLTSRGGPTRFI